MKRISDEYNRIAMLGIVALVSAALDIPVERILSKSRKWDVLEARQLSLYFISKAMPHVSQHKTGKVFGIGHGTVSHAVEKITDMITIGDSVIWEKHQKCIATFNNLPQ